MSTVLTADVIASRALARLENELGIIGLFHRAYEDEFASKVNGYTKGETISIRRPVDYVIRDGATMDLQPSIEGKVQLTIDQQKGVDLDFTSKDMTLNISEFDERFLKSAVSTIVNEVAYDCMAQFLPYVYNYVGTPNTEVNSFGDFYKAVERMNHMAIPMSDRSAILNPTDHAGMLGNLTGLYIAEDAKKAYRQGALGDIGGVDVMMSQVVPSQDYGDATNTSPLVDGNNTVNTVSYDTAKNTWTQTLVTDGWATSKSLKAGQVFTIADVYMVNPRNKRSTGILQQFVVMSDVTTNANGSNDTEITISPPIITSGPHQTVTLSGSIDGKAITLIGPLEVKTYRQNIAFAKGAFALAMVPMAMPQAVGDKGSRKSYKGLSIRLVPVYDGVNDVEKWRLDVLYGRKLIDPRLAVRFSGTT